MKSGDPFDQRFAVNAVKQWYNTRALKLAHPRPIDPAYKRKYELS